MDCQLCHRPIEVDIDFYTIICNTCLDLKTEEADNRATRPARGDLSLPDLTDSEQASILAKRAEDRVAIMSPEDSNALRKRLSIVTIRNNRVVNR